MDIFGKGVYSFSDAAKLVRLKPGRVREWFRGKTPVFHSSHDPLGTTFAISFFDLVEVFVAGHLREHGVSLTTVRKVHDRLRSDFRTPHPFARKELLTDGQEVFVRGIDKHGEEEIYEALTKQKAFPKLILPFLKQIDYGQVSELADRWNISDGVAIDPRLSFGQPVLTQFGIPTYLIAAEYHANGADAEKVAGWYRITSSAVMDAVR
nr:DUF433 domain-containing protein [Fimbriiglobus sp.]